MIQHVEEDPTDHIGGGGIGGFQTVVKVVITFAIADCVGQVIPRVILELATVDVNRT